MSIPRAASDNSPAWHSLPVADALHRLAVAAATGLSQQGAAERLEQHGRNRLPPPKRRGPCLRFALQFHNPLIYVLLAAGTVTFALGDYIDAGVIVGVVLINAVIGFVQEGKAEKALEAVSAMLASRATVLREGERHEIDASLLVPGDIVFLESGARVPADLRLLRVKNLRVNEAALTGESVPAEKRTQAVTADAAIGDRLCLAFSGTVVSFGQGQGLVVGTGQATEIGRIGLLVGATRTLATPLTRRLDQFARQITLFILVVGLLTFLYGHLVQDMPVLEIFLAVVGLAVAAIPEGLPAIVTIVLAIGTRVMARQHAIVRRLPAVETLGSVTVICSDKTGTLTRSEMTIERIMTASGGSRVTGVGYAPLGRLEIEGGVAPEGALRAEQIVILSGGSLAGNAALRQAEDGAWEIQGDPTEAAFLVAERKLGVEDRRQRRFERLGEIPFSSERKMMSTIERDHEHGGERILITKGAPDVLMQHCNRIRIGMDVVPFDEVQRAHAHADVERLSDEALRTLAVAYRPLGADEDPQASETLERDLIFVGTVGIIDPPREEAAVAIAEARRAGIRVMMITGDHPRTASRIAALLGIVENGTKALTGAELDAMDDAGFAAAVRATSVYARVAPVHKLRIVDALQADGNVVAMTGDGVNDAPALKAADIGVAMGITGTEVTKEAAKMILADDNFATIVEAVREGRGIFDNIRKFLRYLLSSNMGEVLTVFLGVVGAGVIGLGGTGGGELVLPVLATQILWINLITDSGPALAMGIDPETDDVMARPPRKANERAIDGRMWRGVIAIGLVMALATLLTIDLYLPGGLVEGAQSLDQARTAGFTVLVLAQLFNCFNARSETTSAFSHLFMNRWLWAAIGLSFLLQVAVVNFAPLNVAFGTVPLPLEQWLVCVAMGSNVLWFSEIRKWTLRRWSR